MGLDKTRGFKTGLTENGCLLVRQLLQVRLMQSFRVKQGLSPQTPEETQSDSG